MEKEYKLNDEDRRAYLEDLQLDCDKKISVLDGFEDCLLYYAYDELDNPRAVYCYEDMVEHFARENNCSYTSAVEYVDYNVMRTIPYMYKVGDIQTTTPLVIHRIDPTYTTLDESYFRDED